MTVELASADKTAEYGYIHVAGPKKILGPPIDSADVPDANEDCALGTSGS